MLASQTPLWLAAFSNDSLTFEDNLVIWLNVFGAMFAGYWTLKASRLAVRAMRPVYAAIFTITQIYIFGYLVLLFTDVDVLDWGSVMRGVSIMVWLVVWSGPAIMSIRLAKLLEQTAQRVASQITTAVVEPEPEDDEANVG